MGINFSVIENTFQFRDVYKCIEESDTIENALRQIFYESCNFRIEDYYDHNQSVCSYETKNNEFKIFLTCSTCKVGPFCPFCFSMGGHRKHKTQKEWFNFKSCSCSPKFNKCNQHNNNNMTTTTTTTMTNSNLELNFKEVKKEVHLFFRYLLTFLLEKPYRPSKKNNNPTFSVYFEILEFINDCAKNSKYLAHVISQEIISRNVDLEKDETISLVDLIEDNQFKSDIRYSVPLESVNLFSEKDFIPPLQNSTMGLDFIKKSDLENNTYGSVSGRQQKQLPVTERDKLNANSVNIDSIKNSTYLTKLYHVFSTDLKCAHIDLLSTLIERDSTFKILFYRHFFNIHIDNLNPNDRYSLFFLDTFYNDKSLISIWVEKSNLIKNIILVSDGFENHFRNFTSFRFLPDIIRTNRRAAIYLVRRDLQKLTSLAINVEDNPIVKSSNMNHVRIKQRYFTQNLIFLFIYLHRQQVPINIQQYFSFYLDSLEQWKPSLKPSNESEHLDYYDCFPMLLSTTVIENETQYDQLKITAWSNVVKYTFLLARFYILSQTSYLTVCKRKPTSSLAMFPIVGVEVTSTLNTLQILSIINFKKLLNTLLSNETELFDVEEIVFSAYQGSPTHLIYRFLINILESNISFQVSESDALYHFVNLVHRGIDVPLDLGKSNSIFRHYPSNKIQEILNTISQPSLLDKYIDKKKEMVSFDFILSEKIHKSEPVNTIQSSLLSDTVLREPKHCSRTLNPSFKHLVDNYYCFTNIYHLEYYGYPDPTYPLVEKKQKEEEKKTTVNSRQLPNLFRTHMNSFYTLVLKEKSLYDVIFRDLLFTLKPNISPYQCTFVDNDSDNRMPSVISNNTATDIKEMMSKDLIHLCGTLLSYGNQCIPIIDKPKLANDLNEYFRLSDKSKFKPSLLCPLSAMLANYTVKIGGQNLNFSIFSLLISSRTQMASSSRLDERYNPISNLIDTIISIDQRFLKTI